MSLPPKKLASLREIASAATQEWKDADDWYHDHTVGVHIYQEDCEHIAAFSPDVALALIAEIEAARERLGPAGYKILLRERRYQKALESIAARHLEDADTRDYWLVKEPALCAEVCEMNTQIAREALKGSETI